MGIGNRTIKLARRGNRIESLSPPRRKTCMGGKFRSQSGTSPSLIETEGASGYHARNTLISNIEVDTIHFRGAILNYGSILFTFIHAQLSGFKKMFFFPDPTFSFSDPMCFFWAIFAVLDRYFSKGVDLVPNPI